MARTILTDSSALPNNSREAIDSHVLPEKVMLAVGLAIAVACWMYVGGNQSDRATRYSTSTYSAGPWGCKALYLTLAELNLPVTRFRKSFRKLKSHKGYWSSQGRSAFPFATVKKPRSVNG